MADSITITKNLTTPQMALLHQLDELEIVLFNIDTLPSLLTEPFDNLNELVENLTHKHFLLRIERGKYCRSTFRDENVIGTFLVEDGVIAYWSALNLHGLTEQFGNTIYVQCLKRKPAKQFLGTSYSFVTINQQKKGGVMYNGYGNYKYAITDIEKTIVDCFDLPRYSGGYAELIRAFKKAELNADKLIRYCEMVDNCAIIKRMGYLASLLEKESLVPFTEYALTKVNAAYNLFDPSGTDTGNFNSQWRLRLNISEQEMLDIVQKQY